MLHDYELSQLAPSLQAAATTYVAIRLTEKFKRTQGLISDRLMVKLVKYSSKEEGDIVATAKKVLFLSQNFESVHSGLTNLKKTHFKNISKLISN